MTRSVKNITTLNRK